MTLEDLITALSQQAGPRGSTFAGRVIPQGTTPNLRETMMRPPTESPDAEGMGFLAAASPAAIAVANKTARAAGAVGNRAMVPRLVEEAVPKSEKILDYGSGPQAMHANRLRGQGFDVTAHDFGSNVTPGVHDPNALSRQYGHTYASNVLNVQGSLNMLRETLDQIAGSVAPGGSATVNLPASPRKFIGLDAALVEKELRKRFTVVERVGGTAQAPVYGLIK